MKSIPYISLKHLHIVKTARVKRVGFPINLAAFLLQMNNASFHIPFSVPLHSIVLLPGAKSLLFSSERLLSAELSSTEVLEHVQRWAMKPVKGLEAQAL